jgi:tetratricopeptide (TPR) repeat protein
LSKPYSTSRLAFLTAALLLATGAMAADNVVSKDAPDLTAVRALVKAKDFKGAINVLTPILGTHQHADVYNLMAFSLRKSGNMKDAATYYAKALDYDANHKSALEYQGEMFVELGQLDKAKANLVRLVVLCPQGCEEREDLEKAIAEAPAKPKVN